MQTDGPKTISLCMQPGQLGRLDLLVSAYRRRSEFMSRSAVARRALNLGLDALLAEEPDEVQGDDVTPSGNAGGCAMEMMAQ